MKMLFVRRVYTKQKISVVVDIDFIRKTVSLVEKDGSNKKWVFAERTPEFMNGWLAILNAMQYAVEEAKKELDAVTEKEHEEFLQTVAAIGGALQKGGR